MHSWGNALGVGGLVGGKGVGKGVGSVSKWCLSHSPVPVIVVRWVSFLVLSSSISF